MFRSCQFIIRELWCSLLKLYYNIHSLIRFCKQGVVAACHVVWECVVERERERERAVVDKKNQLDVTFCVLKFHF